MVGAVELAQVVVVQAQSRSEVVAFVEVMLEKELCIHVLLVYAVEVVSVSCVEAVHGPVCHQGYVGVVLMV